MSERFRQVVPRPPGAVRSAPAAQFIREPDPVAATSIAAVRSAVTAAAPLVGLEPDVPGAAVLVALDGDATASARVVLIRRSAALRTNPGEIAFPGGWIEPGEAPLEAALREAEEEIALARDHVLPFGELPLVRRAMRPERIAPFVGEITGEVALAANPEEVDDVMVLRIADLYDPERYWEERWELGDGRRLQMQFFDIGDDVIWGATARILSEFLDLLVGREDRA